MITLEQAQQLVTLLEQGEQGQANQLIGEIIEASTLPIYHEVGRITRQLHDSLAEFRIDPRLGALATYEIPDARDRLTYVIDKTEEAANRTMDAVERCLPMAEQLGEHIGQVRPSWNQLMRGDLKLAEFKNLCHEVEDLLTHIEGDSGEVKHQLTEILMAQDFQDLTGQTIRRVIVLVHEVEEQLVEILKAFGIEPEQVEQPTVDSAQAEGPIIHPDQRQDVVNGQDDVDDLLSSLGF
ncbi:Protein phosphatase CheZ [Vibrio stylophorae]|uniref:Protein phosphatase CheZ n=1 Tax=Vibrio stylophorae TaxID=659351 RepID=A0ABN8DUY1_9VIBR|nr:protein phosphatase CheZ [Vibrio stylophorae]CAH0534094.1 Protein phosphatase CheZ [Vibrio stylophorae]